jgi:hypothetical protein
MKTIRVSGVYAEMAKEKMKKRNARTIEEYVEMLIQKDYNDK